MMNDKEKERIEKCVVQVECVNKKNNNDIELGTGFFIEKNIIVTASHVVDNYYINPSNYIINIIPINAGIDREIKVVNIIENKRNNFIAIMELDESVEIEPLKFTLGYTIKRDDIYFCFGHPQCKRRIGYFVENKVVTTINKNQSQKVNWDLNLNLERLDDFSGFSGSPIIIDDMLVGIVQTQSDIQGKAISIGMSDIELMKKFIPDKYCEKYNIISYIRRIGGINQKKIFTIDDIDNKLKESTKPSIGLEFFKIDDEEFEENLGKKLDENIYIVGKSREETLYCVLNELKYNNDYNNKVLIAGNEEAWEFLSDKINGAILIPDFYVGEIIAIKNNRNIFIYGEDEHCTKQKRIELKRRTRRTIINKLEEIGMDSQVAYNYVENTNGLFLPLKRKLFNGQYNIKPVWYNEKSESFVTALLFGKWTECQGDKAVIEELSGKSYERFMNDLIPFIKGEEPFIIEILDFGKKRYQLANIEIAWEYLDERIQKPIWDKFIELAYKVIIKMDPIFNKPFKEHYKASLYNEKPENSNELKLGIIRSMIFRGIYRDTEYQYEINRTVKNILMTIQTMECWGYFSQFFTELCEASPESVLERLEHEIKNPTGLKELFTANSRDMFTVRNYYTHVLWGVEQLLLYKEFAARAVKWLLIFDNMNLKYYINNSPGSTLRDVFCTWFNISVLTVKDKIVLSKYAIKKYNNAWELIFNELPGKHQSITCSGSKPKYRQFDEIEQITNADVYELYNEYAKLCIDNINNNINRWLKMINEFSIFPDEMLEELLNKLKSELNKMRDYDKSLIKDALRKEIYRHRYFAKSTWSMEEEQLEKIEKVFISINFDDEAYDYLYLFIFNMPILHPTPYDKENKTSRNENDKIRELEIEEKIKRFKTTNLDIIHLIKLVDKESYNNLGMYIAKYYTKGKFEIELYRKMVGIKNIKYVILSYVSYIYRNYEDKSVIKQAKLLSKNYDCKDELYVDILKIENLFYTRNPEIINEDEHIKELFWSKQFNIFSISNDKQTLVWVLEELKNYNNIVGYIECLYKALEIFEPEELFEYVFCLTKFNTTYKIESLNDYYIIEILNNIHKIYEERYEKYYQIMLIEMYFRNIISWDKMKCTKYILKKVPDHYAQVIDFVYLHEGEEKNSRTKEESELGKNLFDFYYKALFCPCEENGYIDFDELSEWVKNLEAKLKEQSQLNLLGHVLGRLFAYSPVGSDGYYPHESVREIIEKLKNDSLRKSYVTTECNKRGVHSPDAGKTEKEIALKYKKNADGIRILFSECAKIYDDLHENYYYQSETERRRAENEY